jgi:ribosomal protein S18 acetylase RimI-like enzyme
VHLQFKRFQLEHYPEYASWFVDSELNRHLGPMDKDWLNAVPSEPESSGVTWAVFRDNVMVAVLETAFDPENPVRTAITALATRPDLRQQGIGISCLRLILSHHRRKGITEHVAYISMDNTAGQGCFEKAGFAPVTFKPDEQGYIELQHHQ